MRRLLLVALLLLPVLAAGSTGADDMRLTVKPLLCIIDDQCLHLSIRLPHFVAEYRNKNSH